MRLLSCLLLLAGVAAAADASLQVTARLTTPREVVVEWKTTSRDHAGHIVEYINHPTDEWVILGFLPAGHHRYTHPRLAPGTPYSYRVRPFRGPASAPIHVTVAEGLSDKAYADAYAQPEDYSWAAPKKESAPGKGVIAQKSVRSAATAPGAAPTQFQAELMKATISGFRLTWADRSSDEEGFLIERVDSERDFTVCAIVEPDTTTFGWALEPPARKGTFRVRACYFGAPSNVVNVMTGGTDGEPGSLAQPGATKAKS